MASAGRISTREWLDPPGPLRRLRLGVAGLAVLSVLATAAVAAVATHRLDLVLAGLQAIALSTLGYLVVWAVDLLAFYTDPDGPPW